MSEEEDDFDQVWEARADALCTVFGQGFDNVYHAPHPFQLGGYAEVMAFHTAKYGAAYVTVDLSGKPTACYADYELMICHRTPSDWGPNFISRLSPYTQTAYLHHGDTMDVPGVAPSGSLIAGMIFLTFDTFRLFGGSFDLRLCLGITQEELDFKLEHGYEPLVNALKAHSIYPFTDLERGTIPLQTPKSGESG